MANNVVGMHPGASAPDQKHGASVPDQQNQNKDTEYAYAPWCIPTIRTALGVVVGGYKQAVTSFARRNNIDFGWQPRYYDHIIRGTHDGNMISEYIEDNVSGWADDSLANSQS